MEKSPDTQIRRLSHVGLGHVVGRCFTLLNQGALIIRKRFGGHSIL